MLEDPYEYQEPGRITVMPYALLAVLIFLVGIILWPLYARAEPRFQVQNKDITVTLYDEPCELKEQVTNLPYKATWQEGGKTFQGCFAPRPDAGVVIVFFDDKTVALIPFDVLKKVVGV